MNYLLLHVMPSVHVWNVPQNVSHSTGGYSLAYFEWKILYELGLKSQSLHSCNEWTGQKLKESCRLN